MRICSLLPSATEIAFALGLGDSVVGVSHECDFPQEAKDRPVVVRSRIDSAATNSKEIDRQVREQLNNTQSLYTLDLPQLEYLKPDLLLTQELCQVCAVDYHEVEEACFAMDPPPQVISLAPGSLADVFDDIRRVAQATDSVSKAESLITSLKARIEHVRDTTATSEHRPRVACLEWLDPIFTGGHWIPEMVELAGGEDVLAQPGQPSAMASWEEVVNQAPETLILMPCGFNIDRTLEEIGVVTSLPGWANLPAVTNGRVFAVAANALFSRPGPRLIDGLELMAQLIHPELFPRDIDPSTARNTRSGF
jgi:iron complex transport system substrate-binding protein